MRKALTAALLLMAAPAFAAERLPDAEIAQGALNLARAHAIAFALNYRLTTRGNLRLGATLHEHAVALRLRDDELVDPWGTPYRISIDGNDFW